MTPAGVDPFLTGRLPPIKRRSSGTPYGTSTATEDGAGLEPIERGDAVGEREYLDVEANTAGLSERYTLEEIGLRPAV